MYLTRTVPAQQVRAYAALALILLAYAVVSALTIDKFPKVWMDTTYAAVESYHLATEGALANPFKSDAGFSEHVLAPRLSLRLLIASVYKAFGFGIVQTRTPSLIAGALLVTITFLFAKSHYGAQVAVAAALLLVTDNVFFVTSRTARADILVALLTLTALFSLLHALRSEKRVYYSLTGIAIGVSLYTHPNAFLVVPALMGIWVWDRGLGFFRSQPFLVFCASAALAFAPYAVYVLAADYQNGFADFLGQMGRRVDLANRDFWGGILIEYKRYQGYIYFPNRLVIFLVQIGVILYVVARGDALGRKLAAFVLIYAAGLPFWNPGNPTARYFIVVIPVLCILLARVLVQSLEAFRNKSADGKPSRAWMAAAIVGGASALFVNQTAGDAYMLWKHRDHDFDRFIQEIRSSIPPGARVWGAAAFWMGLRDYPYLNEIASLDDLKGFRPEYVILNDVYLWGSKSATVGRSRETSRYPNLTKHAEELCGEKGVLVSELRDPFYGDINVCAIRWSDE